MYKMKICLISCDYLPLSTKSSAKMMHELAVEFVSCGHSVTVVTPSQDLESKFEITQLDGVTIYRFRSGKIKNISKVKRAVNETLLSYLAWRAFKTHFQKHPHELIIYHSPTIFWGSLVARLKKIWGATSYLVLRDFFPQWVIDNGMLRATSPITSYFRFFEALNYRAADTIGVQSPKNLAWFSVTSSVKKPLDVLYNWATNESVEISNLYHRKALGLENKVVYFYGGNIGHAQNMMNIVRLAIAMRSEPKAHFVLVGAGDEVELVRNSIAKHDCHNMTLLPPITQDEYKKMLAEFDIGLFSLHHDHITHNFPGKLLSYMAQKKPILGSINPGNDLQGVIEKANAGFVTVTRDDEGLLNNALKLLHNAPLREAMGVNGKQLLSDVFSVQLAAATILTARGRLEIL